MRNDKLICTLHGFQNLKSVALKSRPTGPDAKVFQDVYELHCPPDETIIWRYIDLAKFVSMLDQRGLFFCSIPVLQASDKWEAAYPPEFVCPGATSLERKALSSKRQSHLLRTFVNCWHQNPHESTAMWKVYAAGAYTVAIRATVGGLKKSLSRHRTVEVHSVEYIDYMTDIKRWYNLEEPLFTKHKHYAHEQEVRAVTYTKEPMPGIAGLVLKADLKTLAESIYVSPHDPHWFKDVVESILRKYGLGSIPVVASRLNDVPTSL